MGEAVGFGELTKLPPEGWELHSALDRVLKKTNRLLNYIIVVVVVVVIVVVVVESSILLKEYYCWAG